MKIALIVLVVVVLGGAIFWFNQKQSIAPTVSGSSEVTAIVSPASKIPVRPDSACQPYLCADGYRAPRCTDDEFPINYIVNPCHDHGGEVIPNRTSPLPTSSKPISTPMPSPKTHLIIFANDTANPLNLTIRTGDTVKFVNNDDAQRWPASGVHPTHQICPGFDSLRGLNKDESYSYTFPETKTCPWHDHLAPSIRGQILVINPQDTEY